MRRKEHTIARAITLLGLVATACYLAWRARYSLDDTNLWLSIPVLLVESTGFLGGALLAWGLWPHRRSTAGDGVLAVEPLEAPLVDVMVRVHHQDEHELRATLMALRAVAYVGDVIVVDTGARAGVASVATEFQHVYAATDPNDLGGLAVAVAAVRTPRFLLLDAGDVPATDIVARLSRELADERVAVVQGLGVSFADDSIEHGPSGRHDLAFERSSLNPSLGTRGCAVWTGSGSLVCLDALREVLADASPAESSLQAHWSATAALLCAGWKIVAPAEIAVVAHRTERVESVVYADRRARVRAARELVAARRHSFTAEQRMAMASWCVRPLSGVRRALFIGLLVAAIYAGWAPFSAPLSLVLALWLPGFSATAMGLGLLSGWRLRPGDRARWSLVSMGPAASSWRAARAGHSDPFTTLRPAATAAGSQFGMGLVVAITAMCVVLLLRGISDQFTHALGRIPDEALVGLFLVALWTLAMALDVLRLLARRSQMRKVARVVTALPAVLADRSARIIDLTPHGAGLVSQTATMVGERALLVSTITTASGATELRVPCLVRSVSAIDQDTWRIGVTFGDVNNALANALSEFCAVEPMWERLGVMPDTSVTEARRIDYVRDPDEAFVGRGVLRLLAIVALVSVVGSSLSGNIAATSGSPLLVWAVTAFAAAIALSLSIALIRPHFASHPGAEARVRQSLDESKASSFSPDLAIK